MVTVADLGILRDIRMDDGSLVVTITPTYSGCPALTEIARDLHGALTEAGLGPVTVQTTLAPAWTTDWITDGGPAQAGSRRDRAARTGPPRPGAADPLAQPGHGWPSEVPLPAVRLPGHRADRRVQRHRVQGAAPLPVLRRAVRAGQGAVMSGAAGSRTEFHALTVGRVEPLTDDSAAVTFDVPAGLASRFAFAPGQSLTVRHGAERRSLLDLRGRGPAAPDRGPRGARRRGVRVAGPQGQGRRRASRSRRRRARSCRTWPRRASTC